MIRFSSSSSSEDGEEEEEEWEAGDEEEGEEAEVLVCPWRDRGSRWERWLVRRGLEKKV